MGPAAPDAAADHSDPARAGTGFFLFFFFLFSLFLRTWFAWDRVFAGTFVRFSESDAWYHLRLIENLLHHFPFPLTYDPYLTYPGGQGVNVAPGFDLLVACLAMVLGAGSPSTALVERIAAVVPPLLGALVVFPVYVLGRSVFTPRSGLFAAALVVVLPGQFLLRSTLGFADHHVAEVLFSTLALALFMSALDAAHARGRMPSVLAGAALALYLTMWSGGALLVFALGLGVAIHLTVAHLRGDPGGRAPVPAFLVALFTAGVIAVPLLWRFSFVRYHLVAVVGGGICAGALAALSLHLERRRLARLWFPVTGAALVVGVVGIFIWLAPSVVSATAAQVRRLIAPSPFGVGEATPLFASEVWWPFLLFSYFGAALPLALLALVPLGRAAVARGRCGPILLAAWFFVTLGATMGQVRFGYYLAIPVAVLAGSMCDRLIARSAARKELVFLTIVLVVFVPAAQLARAQAAMPPKPSDEWYDALRWMREHTPEPFGDRAVYFDRYVGMSQARPYPFPPTAYGVLSWWEPGHWIIRIARRPPNTNPTQSNVRPAAEFFLSTDEAAARARLEELGTRYVIASSEMPAWPEPISGATTGQFRAMVRAIGGDESRYYDVFYERAAGGSTVTRILYYPDYYRTMLSRLYVNAGRQTQPQGSTYVAFFSDEFTPSGERRKALISLRPFGSYDEAARVVERYQDGYARVVGVNPLQTCVPLESLGTFTQVYRSPTTDARAHPGGTDPAIVRPSVVQIFEATPASQKR